MTSLNKNEKGFSLIEIILYIAILVIVLSVLLKSFSAITISYNKVKSINRIESSVIIGMERMEREIRNATSIDLLQSVFNTSPGSIFLNATDSYGNATTTKFYISNQSLKMMIGGADQGSLVSNQVQVTSLIFVLIDNTNSKEVKIEMTLQSGTGSSLVVKNFYDSVVLRGSYK